MSSNISSLPSVPVAPPARSPAVAPEAVNSPKPAATATEAAELKRPAPVQESPKPSFDPEEAQERLNEAVERMNEHMRKNNYNLAFSVDKQVDKVVVKVTNLETGDVVRQIPNEAALRIAHSIEDMRGLLQDKKI